MSQSNQEIPNGLDQDLNPILEDDGRLEPRPDEKDIRACEPLRNVDWQGEAQEMVSYNNRMAAHGQRCGVVAPPGKECRNCKQGKGVFSTCVVNFAGNKVQSGGACMNCVFNDRAHRCSLRERSSNRKFTGKFTEDWVTAYVASKAPANNATADEQNENEDEDEDEDMNDEDAIGQSSGSTVTQDPLAQYYLDFPWPRTGDGGPGWNPQHFGSMLEPYWPEDAAAAMQAYHTLGQIRRRARWEQERLNAIFHIGMPPSGV